MTPGSYLIISALVTGVVLLLAWTSKKPEIEEEPPPETTRWKRFRVHFGALHAPSREPATLVAEEPGGLKLVTARGPQDSPRRLRILQGGEDVIQMARGAFFSRDRLRVLLKGQNWLNVRLLRPGEKKPRLDFVNPADGYEIQGNVAEREFEVRRKGRLIANVSWQRPERDTAPRKDYVLESVKGEDPLPLVALVLAVEAVMGPTKS